MSSATLEPGGAEFSAGLRKARSRPERVIASEKPPRVVLKRHHRQAGDGHKWL